MTSVEPISDASLASIADAAQRYVDHVRPTSGEDLWAMNITSWMGERMAYVLARLTRAEQTPLTPTVVYRAYWETVPLGLYTTREAAREHCLASAAEHGDDVTGAQWVPVDDAEDDPEELAEECLQYRRSGEADFLTDYSVIPLTVAAAYDPEAEG